MLFVVACFLNPVSCYLGDATDSEGTSIYVPEINLRGGELGISSGGSYDFGKVQTASSRSIQFVIENLGRDYLSLKGSPFVQVSGTDASMFVVTVQPSTPISPYSYRSFTVVFTPATDGVKTATVTI
ncbi:MAG TPA: choice-of-anchor D domain-containing protein, partial [Spirochaetota bacterium]|nr:choice-of-anchor D domain-containing protein [Spirochaetota bacterium]